MKKLLAVLLLVAVAAAAGAAAVAWQAGWLDAWLPAGAAAKLATPIRELRDDPELHPDGTSVRVHGKVVRRFDVPFAEEDLFRLDDASGEAWVRTASGLPPESALVTVAGTLKRVDESFGPVRVKGLLLEAERVTVH